MELYAPSDVEKRAVHAMTVIDTVPAALLMIVLDEIRKLFDLYVAILYLIKANNYEKIKIYFSFKGEKNKYYYEL